MTLVEEPAYPNRSWSSINAALGIARQPTVQNDANKLLADPVLDEEKKEPEQKESEQNRPSSYVAELLAKSYFSGSDISFVHDAKKDVKKSN